MEKKKPSKTEIKKRVGKSKTKKDFLVVGLGASAGGVKALQEFFATMPPNSGMAFVAILHLSPEHESSLAQILQARTSMPVTQVNQTVKVEPNNVYVIPPNQQLEMVDGVIRPAIVERPAGYRIAIDVFFRTLAEAYERNAVCVVLSGTGSDGTLGLKRVKESNGFAIVQSPEDAEYDSMPRSAINTQLADWVLPVNQMPEKLLGFKESSEKLHLTDPDSDAKKVAEEIRADESLREILTLLRVRTGHDFANYKTPTLVRRIARHLQIHELEDIPSYLELMRNNPNEVQSLLKNLLINVTNFFRDKQSFEALESEVIPNIFAGKTGKDTVRVWSCGCASGEEAYSLAMILSEYADKLPDPPKFQIFASDVDDEAIAEAREHRYPESIEADVSPERLKRFFFKEGSSYRIRKELREAVLFAPHNVLRDPPFSRLDFISCRNLLIYLNRETQERVMQIFHFSLASHGYLFLGSSETAESVAPLFAPVDKRHRIYSRRIAPLAQNTLPVMPVVGRWDVNLPERKSDTGRERAATLGEIHYKLLENYAPSSVLVNQDFDIVYLSGEAGKFLRFSGGEPSRNLLKAINPDLLPDLRAALFTAQREHKSSEFPNIRLRLDREETIINLIVRAVDVEDEASDFLLVIFEEKNSPAIVKKTDEEIEKITDKDEAMETVVRRLEEDLQRTKEHLRFTIEQHETTVEELKASNEELQAINEELRSASEELETSKEELQSVNEELTTVNHELKDKIEETGRINSDLSNLMESTEIATIFLDKNLQIKRYTPPVQEIFNITPMDVGRPLEHFTHHLRYENLAADAEKALRSLISIERETTDDKDRSYLSRFAPYRTLDERIDGVVLNFIDITDRKKAEYAVRVSEDRLQRAINIETVGVIFFNNDIEITDCNEAFVRMSGYTRKELRAGKFSWEAFTPAGFSDISNRAIEEINTTGIATPYEKQYFRKDGSLFWALFAAKRISENEIVEFVTDITEQKRAEELMRQSEQQKRLILESAKDYAIFTLDLERRVSSWNQGAEALMGYTEQEIVGEWGGIIFTPEDREKGAVEHETKTALAKGVATNERFHVRQDGSRFWGSGLTRSLLDEAGNAVGFVKVMRDLTESKQVQEALARSEEKYRTLFNSMDEGVSTVEVIFDENERVVDCIYLENNPAHSHHTGMLPDVIGMRFSELVPDLERFWYEAIERVVKTGESERVEHEVAELDKWFDEHISRVGGTGSRQVVLVYNNITERKRTEANLAFSAEVSEDLVRLTNIDETMNTLGAKIGEHFGATLCIFSVIDAAAGTFTNPHVWYGEGAVSISNAATRLADFYTEDYERASRAGETWVVRDAATDKRAKVTNMAAIGIAAVIHVPLIRSGEWRFSLSITDAEPHDWRDDEIELMRELANRIWTRLERARAEEALQASEERYGLATQAVKAVIYDWNITEDKIIRSPELENLIGFSPDEKEIQTNAWWKSRVHPEDAERAVSLVREKIKSNATRFEDEYRIEHRDGHYVWVSDTGIFLRDERGKAVRCVGSVTNITERRRIEQIQRESEEKFRTIFHQAVSGIAETDLNGKFVRVNDRYCEIVGYPCNELLTMRMQDITHPDDAARNMEMFTRMVEKGVSFDIEKRYVRKDGTAVWVHNSVAVIKDASGKSQSVVAVSVDINESKRAEERLRESEERLRLATEAAEAYSWEFDVKSGSYQFSANAPKVLGIAKKNLPRTVDETYALVHPDDKQLIEKTLKTAVRTGEGFTLDFRTVTQRGKIVWLAVQSVAVKNEKGKPERIIGIAQNITERKQADELLRESEERMRIAIEAGELATWEWDIPAERVIWNERHFKLFGMKPSKKPLKPEDFFYHVHVDDRERVAEKLNAAVKKKIPFEAEFRADIEHDGIRWMNGYGRVIETDRNGKATKMSGVMFDITERKRSEDTLRKSEEQLQLILESTKDYAIITFDLDGRVTRWNSGAEKTFGYAETEIIGQPGEVLFTPEDRAAKVPAGEMATSLEKGRAEDERWHVRKNGSRFFASGVMQPLVDGKLEGYVKITRDQTERLKAETILREQELLRQFVRTQEDERRRIAREIHDQFGQQLTALRLKLDGLRKTCAKMDVPERKNAAAQIEDLQKTSAQLDRDVDFLAWELRPASLEDLGLRLTLQNFVKEWSSYSGVKTEFHTSGLGKIIMPDVVQTNLYRIAQEALNNILKHADAKSVSVMLEKRKDEIILIIEDDGIGFDQNKKMTRPRGLGLVGMRERAVLMNGEFELETKKSKGTTIFVRVPADSGKKL